MPAPLRLLLVDDEAPARRRLLEVLSDCADTLPVQVIGETDNGLDAINLLQKQAIDAMLLDIRMPGMDGIEIAQHVQKLHHPPAVIFTTAYDSYACQAFEVNAVDYLMKPVRSERLKAALSKVHSLSQIAIDALRKAHPKARTHLSLTEKGRMILIAVDDIIYLKAEAKYVTVKTAAREYLIEESLIKLESEFGGKFIRVHRNCLVARNRILEIGRQPGEQDAHYVRLADLGMKISVSRRQYSNLREVLGD